MNYPYPWIPREYYAAVMFACKMIRENGYFHQAIKRAANYYDVDENELEKHVRARQGAGQKGKKREAGYHFKWFVVAKICEVEATGLNICSLQALKGKTASSVTKRFSDRDLRETMANDYGGSFAPSVYHSVICNKEGYATKEEAVNALKEYKAVYGYEVHYE